MASGMSSFKRAQQWLTFTRQWHILDAKWQDPNVLGEKIARYLSGAHKPIYHPESDCGDHVIVYNCKDVAMRAFQLETNGIFIRQFYRGKAVIPAWEIHAHDPCRVLYMATYSSTNFRWPFKPNRRRDIERLHLFPDDKIPPELLKNVSNQIEQVQRVPKRLDEYTDEERRNFPALFDLPQDYSRASDN